MVTGTNEILELRFSDGSRLRCTPNHRVWTANRGWVHAEDLDREDRVAKSLHFAPRPMARADLPEPRCGSHARGQRSASRRSGTRSGPLLGWLIGDGCLTDDKMTLVFGSEADRRRDAARGSCCGSGPVSMPSRAFRPTAPCSCGRAARRR